MSEIKETIETTSHASISGVVRSFLEELGKGVGAVGASIQKSGLLPHIIFTWCVIWGLFGFFILLIWIFG